ncbi:four helix bundle protein [Vibrio albus]|jgi:four helix bundle protein|uniref:Four helix bundle protein n=1 Tax=Vibrio albus TaxID=2200953 RepID=A0A2U3BCQ2_9VIBR|nr:four helix bundle protein [Vibrio albus]PWI34560.1 four helix bundle protein [Vibrio albus]
MRFEHLDVWKRASRLSCDIYILTKNLKDYGFKDQITRAGLSVPSNIAEGEERESTKEKIRFFNYATASIAEVITQLYIGIEINYLDAKKSQELVKEAKQIFGMLKGLIRAKKMRISEEEAKY